MEGPERTEETPSLFTHSSPPPTAAGPSSTERVPPTAEVVLDIWAQTLGIPREVLRPDDDFFLLGGDSLAVLAVSKRLVELADGGTGKWPEDGMVKGLLAPTHFYQHRQVASLAAYLDLSGCSASWGAAAAAVKRGDAGNVEQEESGVVAREDAETVTREGAGSVKRQDAGVPEDGHGEGGDAGRKAEQEEQRQLRAASARGDLSAVRALLAAGVHPGGGAGKAGARHTGLAPLHAAANAGQAEVVTELLAAGAGANAKQFFYQRTPAQSAAAAGCAGALALLLAHGAAARVRDKSRLTLMHDAARGGSVACIELLLDAGAAADVNARDKWGRTPLFWTVLNGHADAARRLLEEGADLSPAQMPHRVQRRRTSLVQPPSVRALAAQVLAADHPIHTLFASWGGEGKEPSAAGQLQK